MDPYQVLGVARNADDETIKKAYRQLSKQYHPDNNPGDKNAEERFKTVQSAYEQIMDMRKNGGFSQFGGFGREYGDTFRYRDDDQDQGFDSFFGFNAGRNDRQTGTQSDLGAAAEMISRGSYREAIRILDGIGNRNGDWYYLSAVAQFYVGNNGIALDYARNACAMEPSNARYRELLERMEASANRYNERYQSYDHSNSVSDTCCRMILCNIALNSCCGGPRC
ncbi:MAG: DnaJ domain-containing protein [Lachnospiraceae bacterium]|nr:DnaJ domain-containing protein [Lachnospiraceae bacterium]